MADSSNKSTESPAAVTWQQKTRVSYPKTWVLNGLDGLNTWFRYVSIVWICWEDLVLKGFEWFGISWENHQAIKHQGLEAAAFRAMSDGMVLALNSMRELNVLSSRFQDPSAIETSKLLRPHCPLILQRSQQPGDCFAVEHWSLLPTRPWVEMVGP